MLGISVALLASQDIRAPGPSGDLKGSLVRAEDPTAPVVLIIPGSGPTDRDGNSPLGVTAGSYRLLAEGLLAEGISTVRVDKRGMFGSADAVPDANAVTINDYVDDTRAWVQVIRETTGADCVWLLGHSEGGLVALAAAQEEDAVCGLILVASPGRPLGDVLREQLHANPANAPLLPKADAAIDALAAGNRVDETDLPAPLVPLFAPTIQGFLISVFSLDPARLAERVSKPVLIVQGDADLQVSMSDAEALEAAAPSADLVRLPDTNHALKAVPPNDPAANVATYSDPNLPLAPGVVEAIAQFIKVPEGRD
ncbi:alpha/beta fold hydrolase [Mesorhizobium microcysteis]|uniref:Alpha/beta fold hydrolase n=2 Tax=Neoaquamicrobium microcysteis TaxID=2682781 RepID=A0A5D4H3T4_9HYPH|nr:alpha/beta fold hydrolase [Mesorhizobium microcysteis]